MCWVLRNISEGLHYIHGCGFLHNHFKLDNIVLGKGVSGKLKAIIIDFGKACTVDCCKKYHLSDTEKDVYKHEHSHIAPDLRDGIVKQSPSSDVYALGRILKKVNNIVIKSVDLSELSKQALA